MKTFNPAEPTQIIKLAFPLFLSSIVGFSLAFSTTLFLARLGQDELAAGALVSTTFMTLMVVFANILVAVAVLVSYQRGAKQEKEISHILRDALLMAFPLTAIGILLLLNGERFLSLVGQPPSVIEFAHLYFFRLALSLFPNFVVLVLMQFLIGMGHVRTSMMVTFISIPMIIIINYLFIFGISGFPGQGIAGMGWGVVITYWCLAVGLIAYIASNRSYKPYISGMFQLNRPYFPAKLMQIGLPIGLMLLVEISFFMVLMMLMGNIGAHALAANQITLQCLGFSLIVAAAISEAVTMRTSHAIGAKNFNAIKKSYYSGILIVAIISIIFALFYLLFPGVVVNFFLNVHDPENFAAIEQAKQFLKVCAFLQTLECVKIVIFGALVAFKDTKFGLVVTFIIFWVITLPIGYFTSIHLHWGGIGYWYGMVIGMACGAILLYRRVQYLMDKQGK